MLLVLRSGCRWGEVPRELGDGSTGVAAVAARGSGRHPGASVAGGSLLAGRPAAAALGGSLFGWHVRAGQKRGHGVGLTRKGKGTRLMLHTDGQGVPIGMQPASAQRAEVRLAEATLATVRVAKRRGRPRTRPRRLVCCRGCVLLAMATNCLNRLLQ